MEAHLQPVTFFLGGGPVCPGCVGSVMPMNGFFKKHSQCYYLISVAEGLIEAGVL